MGFGRGYGQPGGRETTIVGTGSEVETPWKVFVGCLKADGAAIAAIAAIVYVVVFWVMCAAVANTFRMPWPPWWLRWLPAAVIKLLYILGRSWSTFWPVLLWSVPVFVILWLVAVPVHAWILIRYRWVPEQIDRNYPAQLAAREASDVGGTFWDKRREYLDGEEPHQQPAGAWHVTAELVDGKTNVYLAFDIHDPKRWERYCRAWQQQRKPAWSVRGFQVFGLGDDYGSINTVFLSRGGVAVRKEYKDGRREYLPNARGRAFIRAFATTPLPAD